jgi:hypothetical protein
LTPELKDLTITELLIARDGYLSYTTMDEWNHSWRFMFVVLIRIAKAKEKVLIIKKKNK